MMRNSYRPVTAANRDGKLGVVNMAKILAGEKAESYIDTGCKLVTIDNAKETLAETENMRRRSARQNNKGTKRRKMNFKKLIVESGKKMSGSGLTVETWGNISFRDKENRTCVPDSQRDAL